MADIIINGTTYSGSPTNTANPQRPNTIQRGVEKIGTTLRAADGTTIYIHRAVKQTWSIRWEKANQVTETAVTTVRYLTGSFSFTDVNSNVITVVAVNEDDYVEGITTNRTNAYLYDLELKLRQV